MKGGDCMTDRVINLTPHPLNLITDSGSVVTIPVSGELARVSQTRTLVGHIEIDGHPFPVHQSEFGDVTGLPDPVDGVVYVVSAIVANAVKGERDDCRIVDDAVRDEDGRIIGVRGLGVV